MFEFFDSPLAGKILQWALTCFLMVLGLLCNLSKSDE
jgi:hypothetical protein